MHLPKEENELIIRYLKDKYPGKYDDMNIEKLELRPYYMRIWFWWQAIAYCGQKETWFTKLEDAPEGLEWITVMDANSPLKNYKWKNGEYKLWQQITLEDCKKYYGD